ncbi:Pyruvate:ferredoxin oxidoreductase (PFOR) (Pyruvate synthase), partial [Durusdinium trenchii]
ENRFAAVMRRDPKHAQELDDKLQEAVVQKNHLLQVLNKEDLEGQFSKLVEGLSDAKSTADMVTILYGSETGNSEEQAKNLMQDIRARGLKAQVSSCDDFDFEELPNQKLVILVVSTCGLGEFPANCKQTWLKLQSQDLPMSWLSGTKFAVFGLGDSTYSQFCVAAIQFDTRLGELGGQRLLKRGVGDDRDEDRYYTGWEAWLPELWKVMGLPQMPLSQEAPAPCYRVDVSGSGKPPISDDDIVPPGAAKLTLLHNSLLVPEKYDRDIRHYEFKIEGTPVSYKTGDSLAVWPRNPFDKVEEFCKEMGFDATQNLRVLPMEGARNWCPQELSVRQLFSHVLDIFGKPNRKFFETLSFFAKDEADKKALQSVVENNAEGQALYRDLTHDFAHHADVFKKFKSARPPIEQLLNMIPVLKPRSYSIASSPLMHADKIQLCVVLVDWTVESTKELRLGECTGYMRQQKPGATMMCAVRQSAIVLPKDPSKPVIMAGMGTGLAPWRAVTQERVCQNRQGLKVGPCHLFFGARYNAEYLYKDEFESYIKEGVLSMHTAFSREQARKIYVQHKIVEAGEAVHQCMLKQEGHFYVCGSARQVPEDIYTAMKEVMMANERVNEDEAEAILSNLKMEGRLPLVDCDTGQRLGVIIFVGLHGRGLVLISGPEVTGWLVWDLSHRERTTPFGPYGGLLHAFLHPDRQSEAPERLQPLGAGTGAADVEYEQFLKAKEVQRAMFQAENKTIVHQCADTDVIQPTEKSIACIDGNQAAAHVAYALSDCAFIYPITPSSPMGEMVDEWAAQGLINCYGQKLSVTEMQSEAGAAGALHGALKAGAFSTTFTASQGLLLMIPNMYKIAGELLPCVMHVAARALAGQALSIFGDHQDVMACRSTGWAMLASESVEMVQYNALVAHLVSMERRVPVQHFFDGFRTSHEVNKVKLIDYNTMKQLINWDAVKEHHDLAMNPRHPHVQGTSQGPDIFFQCVEAGNTFYDGLADLFEAKSKLVEQKTGVHYALYAYEGHKDAEYVIVVMGSGAVTCSETATYLQEKGEKVGVLKVRLFRPWDANRFMAALPKTCKRICVLDRTKEQGSQGEPLFLEVSTTLKAMGRAEIVCIGGRYGLGSKEFTPNMVLSIYENLKKETPKPRFTVGIVDDVTHLSLPVGEWLNVLPQGTTECMFYGLGSDGTVGANKSAVKMIAMGTELYAQAVAARITPGRRRPLRRLSGPRRRRADSDCEAYFEYDAKKSGGVTISHLRFGPKPIHAPYNVRAADYLAVHKPSYVSNYDMTRYMKPNGVCVINCSWSVDELKDKLPPKMRRDLAVKKAKLYIIDATQIAVKARFQWMRREKPRVAMIHMNR